MQESGIVDGKITWKDAHEALAGIARQRGGLELDEARWLLVAEREAVHRHLGFASLAEYLERTLGYSPRVAKDRLRVAAKRVELPAMRAALADGRLAYSAVRELSRVAKAHTDAAWTEAAHGRTVREIEALCRERAEGDLPTSPPRPDLAPRRVTFEMSPETYALWREARSAVVAEVGGSLDDDAALAAILRRALGTSTADAAPYPISVTTCSRCDRGWQTGAGAPIEVPAAVVERAQCDAVAIGRIDGPAPERATQTIPPAVRRLIWERFERRCAVPGCRNATFLEIHHVQHRAHGGDHDPENLALLCTGHHDLHHRGKLRIEGAWPALVFRHADGRPYGQLPPPPPEPEPEPEHVADVRAALVACGFDKRTAKASVDRALTHVGRDAPTEDLLRAAFRATKHVAG